ncbi:hypothetical protein B0H16DRAFT_1891520, partial [Mycena metata]
ICSQVLNVSFLAADATGACLPSCAIICHAVRYVLTPIFRGLDFPCFPSRPDRNIIRRDSISFNSAVIPLYS